MTADMKKRGLGRGLDALFRDARAEEDSFQQPQHPVKRADEIALASAQLRAAASDAARDAGRDTARDIGRKLSIDKLKPGAFQPRRDFDDVALKELAESITAHGVLQPLLVRPAPGGMYEIIAGERRWRAAQLAQIHEVPVVIRDFDDKAALETGLIENLQREDLSPLEEAEGYQRLVEEFNHTQDIIAKNLGKSRSHVANALRLLKLPDDVRTMLREGALSAGHARLLVGAENAVEMARIIVRRNLNVRQAEKLTRAFASGKKKKTAGAPNRIASKDIDILALEEKMTALLGLKVIIDGKGAEGRLLVEYKTLEQLDDILARLSSVPR